MSNIIPLKQMHTSPSPDRDFSWNERLEIVEILGEGSSAVSFLAKDLHSDNLVVLKQYKHGIKPENRKAILREVELLRQLNHAKIPAYIDHYIAEVQGRSLLHVVVKYLPGLNIVQLMQQSRMSALHILNIIEQLLDILVYLQSLTPAILHRDIKPSNILVDIQDNQCQVYLIDFGSAVDWIHRTFGATMNVGTVGFMALEQIHGQPTLKSDLYSVGAVAWELLTRKKVSAHLKGYGFEWESAIQNLRPEIQNWLQQMLATEQVDRFADAFTAKAELQSLLHQLNHPTEQLTAKLPTLKASGLSWEQRASLYWFQLLVQKPPLTPKEIAHAWFVKFGMAAQEKGWTGMLDVLRTILLYQKQYSAINYLQDLLFASVNGQDLMKEMLAIQSEENRVAQELELVPSYRFLYRQKQLKKLAQLQESFKIYEQALQEACQAWCDFARIPLAKLWQLLNSKRQNPTFKRPFVLLNIQEYHFEMIALPKHSFFSNILVSATLVDQKLWSLVMSGNPSQYKNDSHPVENVTWIQAVEFCNQLSRLCNRQEVYQIQYSVEGHHKEIADIVINAQANGFRLPTLQEFKRFSKADEDYCFAGSDILSETAWFDCEHHHPVASKKANGWGIYDTIGNVAEWCWDKDAKLHQRVIVGGSYRDGQECMSSHFHYFDDWNSAAMDLGFRIVCQGIVT